MTGILGNPLFIEGYLTTLALSAGAMLASLFIGTLVASLRVWGGPIMRSLTGAYVEFFRNTPLLVQLLFIVVLLAPSNLGLTRDPLVAALFGLSVYTGAYVTEVVRSGILAVDPRQIEAARTLGLSQAQALRHVVLPQAIRTVIPPLGNLSIALVKNSAIAGGIAATDLLQVARILEARPPFTFDPFIAALFAYWTITIPLAWAVSRLERRLAFAR